jgi:CRISPR-associated protein Cas6
VLRLPVMDIGLAIPLAGQTLEIAGSPISLGFPTSYPLRPAPSLISSLVTIRGFQEPSSFLEAVQRQLDAAGIRGRAGLPIRRSAQAAEGRSRAEPESIIRRTIRIRGKEIVGFPVRIDELTADESLTLQEIGVGGRRRLGCGLFVPAGG